MEGFFSKKETQSKTRPGGKVYSCISCGLHKGARSPKMQPVGKFKKGIMVIGEFPSKVDDRRNSPFQDKAGQLLANELSKHGVDLFEDCLCVNAVNCYSYDLPKNNNLDCCRSVIVSKALIEYEPKLIILLGSMAVQSFLGHRWQKNLGTIDKWRGWAIPDQDHKAWVLPTYNPKLVIDADKQIQTIWKKDLSKIPELLKTPYTRFKEPEIKYIDDLSILEHLTPSLIAFDYETTGLKPHAKGHRIVCAAVAVSEDKVYTFLMPPTKKERQPFIAWLEDHSIGKMAHNMKFEDAWTRVRLRTEIQNWEWDSMQAAHILDNRQEITSLKFQAYVHFGIIDYASDVSPYINSSDNYGNSFNKIEEMLTTPNGEKQLLRYCALDSILEYRLAMKQIKEIDYDFLPF